MNELPDLTASVRHVKRAIFRYAIPIAAVLLAAMSVSVVPAGHVGVVRTFGAIEVDEFKEGLNFKIPVAQTVYHEDARQKKFTAQGTAASKDLQPVQSAVDVIYSVNGALAAETIKQIGVREVVEANTIAPGIQESLKAISAQYTAEELITKRSEAKARIQEYIIGFVDDTLDAKGVKGAIQISNIAITDFSFSREFTAAIEAKQKAEQEALQAKNELLRRETQAEAAKIEKQKAAEAEAYQVQVNADAKAHQIRVESVERAAAIKREAEALRGNPALIELRKAEKWDGVLPRFAGGGAVPFINVDSAAR